MTTTSVSAGRCVRATRLYHGNTAAPAAIVDGANIRQPILRIDIPTFMPTMITLTIPACGHILTMSCDKVLLMQNLHNMCVSDVISTYVYRTGMAEGMQFSYSTPTGLFQSVMSLLIVLIPLLRVVARSFFMNTVQDEMIEAAGPDGARDMQIVMRIVLPLQVVLRNIPANTQLIEEMTNASVARSQRPAMVEVRKYAVTVLCGLPAIMPLPFVQKHFVQGVMADSIKG